ncbi:MAG TPA: acriflavin resistance protein [Candidatus Riflebacteria bacterium]|jgi:HAE1 family hydrophobic/amphiphilic exporter-1|nr:acriflavin resistance protein [Candidatus Riflebacteria bacterium]
MFLATASVKRPVAMSALLIGLTLLGIYSFFKMGLELMPKVDIPYITIVTVFPGASPEQIETDIAKRIEDRMMTLEGLKHISSTCMENACQTLLEFNLGTDVDVAATDVREKLDLARADMPEDVEDPKVLKFDVNSKPVANLALTGQTTVEELYDYADNYLRDKLTVVDGVADAELIGGAKREVQILIDREKLAARGLSTLDVVYTVNSAIKTIPVGRIKELGTEISVEFSGDVSHIDNLKELEISNKSDGRIIFLKDIAEIKMATADLRQIAFFENEPCIAIKIIKRSDANAVATVENLQNSIAKISATLPAGWKLNWVSDDARFIQANASSAWDNIFQGILLTALILFLFLYNFKILLIAGITMPLNIVIGFFFMQYLNYTLNLSTLISIGLSVGILVTNSLVVLEAIMKRFAETGDAKKAAIEGTSASTVPVLASSGTNIVVLFPIANMGSMVGMFLKPLATTMLIMTAVSLFLSFTIIPLLSSILLKKDTNESGLLKKLEAGFNKGFSWVTQRYMDLITMAQNSMGISAFFIIAFVLLMAQALSLAPLVGGGFMPTADMGNITIKLEFPTSYGLEQTRLRTLEAVRLARTLPDVSSILSGIGKVDGGFGRSSEGVYLAEVKLRIADKDKRSISIDEFLAKTKAIFSNFTDAIVTISIPSPAGGSDAPLQVEFSGENLNILDQIATTVKSEAEDIAGFTSMDTTVRTGKKKIKVTPKRNVLSESQMAAVNLGTALRGNVEGLKAATFKKGDRNYDIVVKFAENEGSEQVKEFSFAGKDGKQIALTNFGQLDQVIAPIQIIRKDKQRISKFESYLSASLPMGKAMNYVNDFAKKAMPVGYEFNARGQVEMMHDAQMNLAEAAVIAVVLVLLTLAAIMESFMMPAIILLAVPPMLIGMLWALYLTGYSISIFVIMGGVMLIGIVVNNAILMLEEYNNLVAEGSLPKRQALVQACGASLRPVMMITLAAVLGMLPMAFGSGIGSELRTDIGIASAGGILSSAIISMFLVPIVFNLFLRDKTDQA